MAKEKLFLYQVYRYNKKLFWGIAFFSGFTLFANLSGNEIMPFFVWGMYSGKEKPADHYDILKVTVNDTLLVDYSSGLDNNRFFLLSPLSYYKEIQDNNNIDPSVSFLKEKLKNYYPLLIPFEKKLFNINMKESKFIAWYQRYLEESIISDIRKIQIDVLCVSFNKEQKIVIDSTYLMGKWKICQ